MLLVKTRVGPSSIHGLGLYAVETIPQGTAIWRFCPGFDREFPLETLAGFPDPAREHIRWFSFVDKASGCAVLSGDHACFMNHSPTPNTGAPSDAIPPVTTVALREIPAGEEITCDYHAFDADAVRKLTPPAL